eukprot:SAG22_NODE_8345_length_662_cov_1.278863_1_plen_133_part_10
MLSRGTNDMPGFCLARATLTIVMAGLAGMIPPATAGECEAQLHRGHLHCVERGRQALCKTCLQADSAKLMAAGCHAREFDSFCATAGTTSGKRTPGFSGLLTGGKMRAHNGEEHSPPGGGKEGETLGTALATT